MLGPREVQTSCARVQGSEKLSWPGLWGAEIDLGCGKGTRGSGHGCVWNSQQETEPE
jgi:hypothetical protein